MFTCNSDQNYSIFISLHIRSMWKTICDALASWSGWEFGSKIPVYPILGFGSQNTPSPWKLKFRQFLAFQDFSLFTCPEYPPPHPQKLKFRQILAFQDFSLFTCPEYSPPFHFWLAQNITPPCKFSPRRYVETNICIPRGYRLVQAASMTFICDLKI